MRGLDIENVLLGTVMTRVLERVFLLAGMLPQPGGWGNAVRKTW